MPGGGEFRSLVTCLVSFFSRYPNRRSPKMSILFFQQFTSRTSFSVSQKKHRKGYSCGQKNCFLQGYRDRPSSKRLRRICGFFLSPTSSVFANIPGNITWTKRRRRKRREKVWVGDPFLAITGPAVFFLQMHLPHPILPFTAL